MEGKIISTLMKYMMMIFSLELRLSVSASVKLSSKYSIYQFESS